MCIRTNFAGNITVKRGTPASIFLLNVNFLFLLMYPDFCFQFFLMSIFPGNYLNESVPFSSERRSMRCSAHDFPRLLPFFHKYFVPQGLLAVKWSATKGCPYNFLLRLPFSCLLIPHSVFSCLFLKINEICNLKIEYNWKRKSYSLKPMAAR